MTTATRVKEEFYLRRVVDDVPAFVDATEYAARGFPYPLGAETALTSTCAVWTDDQAVAFSLRDYTAEEAGRAVERVETRIGGATVTTHDVLRPAIPREGLQGLHRTAGALSAVIGDDVIAELDGELFVLALVRTRGRGDLKLVGRLLRDDDDGFTRTGAVDDDAVLTVPSHGVRLRLFLRSPVRPRLIAYEYSGHLAPEAEEKETVTRVSALALRELLGLAPFRMLSGLDHVEVQPPPGGAATRRRDPAGRVRFDVALSLFTGDGTPAAGGHAAGEIDLDQGDPATGGLRVCLKDDGRLEWNPAVMGSVRFATYERLLADAVTCLIRDSLGADAVRDITYDIMLGELGQVTIAGLRAATAVLPGLTADPARAKVLPRSPATT
jgi:hypothetical protein